MAQAGTAASTAEQKHHVDPLALGRSARQRAVRLWFVDAPPLNNLLLSKFTNALCLARRTETPILNFTCEMVMFGYPHSLTYTNTKKKGENLSLSFFSGMAYKITTHIPKASTLYFCNLTLTHTVVSYLLT